MIDSWFNFLLTHYGCVSAIVKNWIRSFNLRMSYCPLNEIWNKWFDWLAFNFWPIIYYLAKNLWRIRCTICGKTWYQTDIADENNDWIRNSVNLIFEPTWSWYQETSIRTMQGNDFCIYILFITLTLFFRISSVKTSFNKNVPFWTILRQITHFFHEFRLKRMPSLWPSIYILTLENTSLSRHYAWSMIGSLSCFMKIRVKKISNIWLNF